MAGIAGIAAVCGFFKEFMLSQSSTRIGIKIRERLFHSVVTQEVGFFDGTKTGTLLSLLSEDVTVMEGGYGTEVGKFSQVPIRPLCLYVLATSFF